MSYLEELYSKAKDVILEDGDDSCFKFSFAFALQKICSECHGGMYSTLYALMSALSLEWQFSMGMEEFNLDDPEQSACFEWLKKELDVEHLYDLEDGNF